VCAVMRASRSCRMTASFACNFLCLSRNCCRYMRSVLHSLSSTCSTTTHSSSSTEMLRLSAWASARRTASSLQLEVLHTRHAGERDSSTLTAPDFRSRRETRELGSSSWDLCAAVQGEKRGKKRDLEGQPPANFQFKITGFSTKHTISTVRRRNGRPSHRLLWRSTSNRLVGAATAGMSHIELMLRNGCQSGYC
jgi:hypothetical protein